MTAADWTPVFVLPHIPLEAAIGCEIAALAPANDLRVTALKRAHPSFRRFLNRFADNFGEKFEPSVLLLNTVAPPIFRDVTALASFRDLIALSTIAHGRALELQHPRGHRVLFGEAFAIYPTWENVALMRSLNMAYHASLLPAGTETTFYDVGRVVSLWVSAFEILVHPGGNGQANRDKVFEMIERTCWAKAESGQLAHDTGGKTKVKRTLASWLYQMLYECRSDFLHGNPVERDNLILPTPQRTIFEYAAPLYRIALTAFLPLTYDVPMPSAKDARALGAYIADRMDFMGPQKSTEEALLTATRPPASRTARRTRVTRPAR